MNQETPVAILFVLTLALFLYFVRRVYLFFTK